PSPRDRSLATGHHAYWRADKEAALVGRMVTDRTTNRARRDASFARLMLSLHANMATYWYRYTLFTPRDCRREFRGPVHSRSGVLTWTSRIPSPSSSRAHSPAAWPNVARFRPISGGPLYPQHSPVSITTIGRLARRTTASTASPSGRSVTVNQSRPLSRPTAPRIGDRSLSQLPCPGAALARHRGGPPGVAIRHALSPCVPVGLVGLQYPVLQ